MEQRKLLLADDSITIQKVINLTFADEGIEVTAVGNGAQAIERLPEIAPDLVLADVHMPGLNGYEVCERIRNTPEFQNVPVMLLVGSFEPFDETEARRVGANDFLTKPFQSIKQLVNKVHGLLDQSATAETAAASAAAAGAETSEIRQSAETVAPVSAQEIGFATETDDFVDLDIPPTDGGNYAFGESEFDDELIETMSVGGNRAQEENAQASADVFETALEDYQATDFQSAVETPAVEIESENEWHVVESDLQTESENQPEEDFINTAPTMELRPETIPTETAETASENFEVEFEDVQPIAEQNFSQNFSDENSAQPENYSADDLLSVGNGAVEQETFQVEFEAADNEPLNLTEEISDEVSEQTFEPSTLVEETFEFSETQSETAETAQNFDWQPAATEMQAEEIEPQDETQQWQEPVQQFAASPAEKVKPFIAPLLDDDDFLLDIKFDEPEIVAAAPQQQTAFAEAVEIESVTPEIVEPADQHPTQELAPINQQTSMEKPAQSLDMSALQFPPEIIDAIAQRVVEKLSDKVIEKIAWEIVPDRFDLIVRKTIKSQDSER